LGILAIDGQQTFNFIAKLNGLKDAYRGCLERPFNFTSGLKKGVFCGSDAPFKIFNLAIKLNTG
jgi:hypothetical protein